LGALVDGSAPSRLVRLFGALMFTGKRLYFFLLLAGLVISLAAASFELSPGYMDSDYYYAGGLRLAAQQSSGEPYLWNYLNDPHRLPAPAFSYWMPLTSYVAAAGLLLFPAGEFWGARLFFILLAAFVPALAAFLSFRLTRNFAYARLAGLLALFSGFYLPYQTTTDSFPIYLILGAVFILIAYERDWAWLHNRPLEVRLLILGLLAGLLHLTRADGFLWLFAALLVGLDWFFRMRQKPARLLLLWLVTLAGYAIVMAPWFGRNLTEWGSLFPPGGSRAMWITEYEQTMIFPAAQLTFENWLAAGLGIHLLARWDAFLQNFQTAVAVQAGIVLFPFMLAGLWKLRQRSETRLVGLMWLLTFIVMTVIFPFAGPNGGFFHSGAGLQLFLWACVPVGIESLMTRYAVWRRLPGPQNIVRFISVVVVVVSALLTVGAVLSRRDWQPAGPACLERQASSLPVGRRKADRSRG
jgi:hypothetical protein